MTGNRRFTLGRGLILAAVLSLAATGVALSADHAIYWSDPADGTRPTCLPLKLGADQTLRLQAEVPAGKTLKAHFCVITFDPAVISIVDAGGAADSPIPPVAVNTETAGMIRVNAFNVRGAPGPATVPLLDVTIRGASPGQCDLGIQVKNFGASATDEFIPTEVPLGVVVGSVAENEATF